MALAVCASEPVCVNPHPLTICTWSTPTRSPTAPASPPCWSASPPVCAAISLWLSSPSPPPSQSHTPLPRLTAPPPPLPPSLCFVSQVILKRRALTAPEVHKNKLKMRHLYGEGEENDEGELQEC